MAIRVGLLELVALVVAIAAALVIVAVVRRRARRRAARGFEVSPPRQSGQETGRGVD